MQRMRLFNLQRFNLSFLALKLCDESRCPERPVVAGPQSRRRVSRLPRPRIPSRTILKELVEDFTQVGGERTHPDVQAKCRAAIGVTKLIAGEVEAPFVSDQRADCATQRMRTRPSEVRVVSDGGA